MINLRSQPTLPPKRHPCNRHQPSCYNLDAIHHHTYSSHSHVLKIHILLQRCPQLKLLRRAPPPPFEVSSPPRPNRTSTSNSRRVKSNISTHPSPFFHTLTVSVPR